MSSPTLVLFAIKSAIRLGQQSRTAYVDATRRRALVLPLPDFDPDPNVGSAVNYFRARLDRIEGPPQLRGLLDKIRHSSSLDAQEQEWLVDYYNELLLTELADDAQAPAASDGSSFTQEGLRALVTVRQWRRGADPHPSTLQRLGGTLIEIGVDYFLEMPGGLNTDSREGRALHAFFTGLDRIDLAEAPLGELPAKLFTATLETVAGHPDLVSEDARVQALISAATSGVATDVVARIDELREHAGADLDKEERVRYWGELVFRSVLSNAGGLVADDPRRFLGVREGGEAALVGGVARAAMALLLDQPVGEMDAAFSRRGLDRVVDAALGAVAEHPELIAGDEPRLHGLITALATDFEALDTLFESAMVPELARIVIARTGENLELLWAQGAADPRTNLALVAARSVLGELSRPAAAGERWKPAFGREQALAVVEVTLDELVANPGWLVTDAGDVSPHLGEAVTAMVGVLRARGDARLSPALAGELLQAGIGAAALRAEFLEDVPGRGPLIAAVLDAILGSVFDPDLDRKAAWRLVKAQALKALLDTAVRALERSKLQADAVAAVEQSLSLQIATIADGGAWSLDDFRDDLRQRLEQLD